MDYEWMWTVGARPPTLHSTIRTRAVMPFIAFLFSSGARRGGRISKRVKNIILSCRKVAHGTDHERRSKRCLQWTPDFSPMRNCQQRKYNQVKAQRQSPRRRQWIMCCGFLPVSPGLGGSMCWTKRKSQKGLKALKWLLGAFLSIHSLPLLFSLFD